ncbi:FBD-associated F-box protein At5g60610 [Sorghum bicolor]|uniref:FBD-associated F-box protein At5g60610 n=1 Tax=Sorghum bicolor TaxID=4558 RepID=UPI000B423EF9|nr:FBD-associated F-box protein At5g60610 [Sorghum bicolor]|eukprot:XP_002463098.2 FBD-associated F-box protein At5g60610 [Sorghum bicolor]
MRHGLDPRTLDIYEEMVLNFIYRFLPKPSVSVAATLSCAAADAEKRDGVDRISGLPDDLLRCVVACLPAKDGARTAVLSTRWRGLWCSVPLVLVDTHFLPRGGAEGRPPSPGFVSHAVRRAVSDALRAHPGPFPFVSISCQFMEAVDADRAVLARCCASLRRLYLGAWIFVDTATLPHGASFPSLQELVLGAIVLEDRDLDFLLSASPVLEILTFIGSGLRARLASHSLRCAQFCLCFVEEVSVLDAPCLERLFIWRCPSSSVRVKIGHAPQLRMLGYLEPGVHVLEIGNTVIKSTTKPSPKTTVPSVRMLALDLQFRIHNEVKMLPSFLRCFPNVETLCIQSEKPVEPTDCLNVKFWEEAGPIKCVQSNLKRLMLREFHGDDNEFAFLMYIAENAKFCLVIWSVVTCEPYQPVCHYHSTAHMVVGADVVIWWDD